MADPGLFGQGGYYCLDLGVVVQGVLAEFSAHTAHLEAAEGGGRIENVVAVDPHRAGL